MNNSPKRQFLLLAIFGIAMGFLEAIVVVYLRDLYYPQGFKFPLSNFTPRLLNIEWLREISTILMLAAIGIIAGKTNLQKFSFFIYAFGVWDIFYYVALKLLLNWPASLLTWDILFLIPVTWTGPVLAPCICALTMIAMAVLFVRGQERNPAFKVGALNWAMIYSGAAILFLVFIWEYAKLIVSNGFLPKLATLAYDKDFLSAISRHVPTDFLWLPFLAGEALVIIALVLMMKRPREK